jgi:hypothetical protein
MLNRSTPGVLLLGIGIMRVRTTAFATTAAGFFSGTAPHEKNHGGQHDYQRKKLLPIHAANITVKANRATVIF